MTLTVRRRYLCRSDESPSLNLIGRSIDPSLFMEIQLCVGDSDLFLLCLLYNIIHSPLVIYINSILLTLYFPLSVTLAVTLTVRRRYLCRSDESPSLNLIGRSIDPSLFMEIQLCVGDSDLFLWSLLYNIIHSPLDIYIHTLFYLQLHMKW